MAKTEFVKTEDFYIFHGADGNGAKVLLLGNSLIYYNNMPLIFETLAK